MRRTYRGLILAMSTVKLREGSLTALLTEQILVLLLFLWCPSWQDIYRFGHQPDGGVPGDDLLLQPEGKIRASHASENDSWCWGMLSCCGLSSLLSRVPQFRHQHCNEYDKTTTWRQLILMYWCQNWWTLNKTICVVLVNINFYGSRLHCHYLSWYLLWIYEHHSNLSLGKYELL